jgi:predicted DNA-binding transcriptional regulator AlpA
MIRNIRGMMSTVRQQAPDLVLYKIPEVMAMLRMSRHVVYEQIRRGRLRTVKEGRATFVTAAAIRAYVQLLEQEAEKAR